MWYGGYFRGFKLHPVPHQRIFAEKAKEPPMPKRPGENTARDETYVRFRKLPLTNLKTFGNQHLNPRELYSSIKGNWTGYLVNLKDYFP